MPGDSTSRPFSTSPPRAWLKKEKAMFRVTDICYQRSECQLEGKLTWFIFPKQVVLCWPTGLLDKNGTEIYEGDIVEYVKGCGLFNPGGYHSYQPKLGDRFFVQRLQSGFTLCNIKHFEKMARTCDGELIPNIHGYVKNYDFWNGQGSLKLLGNIHQHPDLLARCPSGGLTQNPGGEGD